jgi:hypothetical protein
MASIPVSSGRSPIATIPRQGRGPTAVAAQWTQLDPAQYPFVRQVAPQLPGHDDREQFLAGIDLILAGISAEFEADLTPRRG